MTPSELYAERFQNSEPKYYTRIPNIIDHLTYSIEKDGVTIKKRLSVYAKELYRVIRMIASDDGADWHTTERLSEIIGCSVGSIFNAKEELLMPMDQLDGMPLIKEERRSVIRDIGEGKKIKTILCTRTILCIWKWNNAFMSTIKHQNKYGKRPDSCSEYGQPPDSCGESATERPDSCGEANNNPLNKNPLSKEQQPATKVASAVSVCPLNAELPSVPSDYPKIEDKIIDQHNEKKTQAFNWFMKIGCDVLSAKFFVENFSNEDIHHASGYVQKQIEKKKMKNEQIRDIIGYLRRTLEGKWWIKQSI